MSALHLDPVMPGCVPLQAAPAKYLVGGPESYAHLPRSIAVGRYTYAHTWCGVSRRTDGGGRARWTDDPAGRPVCGTCLGRSMGYDPDDPSCTFRPTLTLTSLKGRRWCPGARSLWVERDHRNGTCLLCGHEGRITWRKAGYCASDPALERHQPASEEALVHCPSCGWRRLDLWGGLIRCQTWQCEFTLPVSEARR